MTRFQNTRQPDWDWWGELWDDPEATLRALGADEATAVLDLACGDGFFTIPLAALVDGPVYGVDLDPDYLTRLRDYAAEADADVTCVVGDARNLSSLLTEPVDYVLLANTFHGSTTRRDSRPPSTTCSNPAAASLSSTGTTNRVRRRQSRGQCAAHRPTYG